MRLPKVPVPPGWLNAQVATRKPSWDWLHTYNEHGAEALVYRHTGACPRFCPEIEDTLGEKIRAALT
jgi:hypothetical protein